MMRNNRRINVSYHSLLYLDLIALKEKCTASYLAQALNITKSAVTIKLNEMMEHGLIEKRQSEEDKRVFYLSVREDIAEEYKQYDRITCRAAQKLAQRFSPQELAKFCEMLEAFDRHYSEEVKGE